MEVKSTGGEKIRTSFPSHPPPPKKNIFRTARFWRSDSQKTSNRNAKINTSALNLQRTRKRKLLRKKLILTCMFNLAVRRVPLDSDCGCAGFSRLLFPGMFSFVLQQVGYDSSLSAPSTSELCTV